MPDWIAERTYIRVQEAGTASELYLRVARPTLRTQTDGGTDWQCDFEIADEAQSKIRSGWGVDAIQALLIALHWPV